MPSIEFSPGIIGAASQSYIYGVTFGDQTVTGSVSISRHGLTGYTGDVRLKIMTGTKPTSFSELTNATARDADMLIYWKGSMTVASNGFQPCRGLVVNGENFFILETIAKTVSNAGVATWFQWVAYLSTTPTTIYNQVMGTVGLIGSGADLEIPDVNLVTGVNYKIAPVTFAFPVGPMTY